MKFTTQVSFSGIQTTFLVVWNILFVEVMFVQVVNIDKKVMAWIDEILLLRLKIVFVTPSILTLFVHKFYFSVVCWACWCRAIFRQIYRITFYLMLLTLWVFQPNQLNVNKKWWEDSNNPFLWLLQRYSINSLCTLGKWKGWVV